MASKLDVDEIAAKNGTDPVTLTKQSAAKVWGLTTSAAAVTASFNLSSGTDHGTGDYSYSLSSAFSNSNFSMNANSSGTGAGKICTINTGRKTASVVAIEIENHDGSSNDQNQELAAHGDLA